MPGNSLLPPRISGLKDSMRGSELHDPYSQREARALSVAVDIVYCVSFMNRGVKFSLV